MSHSLWKNYEADHAARLAKQKLDPWWVKLARLIKKIDRIPVRVWNASVSCWYNVKYGIGNLFVWFPIIWRDRDWDHVYLLNMLSKKFDRMANLQEFHGNSVSHMRMARQLKTAKALCDRICNDEYTSIVAASFNRDSNRHLSRAEYKLADKISQQDKDLLGKLISKYIDHWWD